MLVNPDDNSAFVMGNIPLLRYLEGSIRVHWTSIHLRVERTLQMFDAGRVYAKVCGKQFWRRWKQTVL